LAKLVWDLLLSFSLSSSAGKVVVFVLDDVVKSSANSCCYI